MHPGVPSNSSDETVSLLDGAARRKVAMDLWNAWRTDGVGAAIIVGFSGVGKSDRLVRPLIARAARAGIPAVHIDVPVGAADVDQELRGGLVSELELANDESLTVAVEAAPTFDSAIQRLVERGTLVVVDEFQRLLDKDNQPIGSYGPSLQRLARRPFEGGCLWLVANRTPEAVWAEPFYVAQLEPPLDEDAASIILRHVGEDREDRLPPERRTEIVRRLGANPRVLRLLGYLLRTYDIEELLGPPGELPPAMPFAPVFVEDIETSLLEKAEEGLSDTARRLLTDLSIVRGWAEWSLVEAIGGPIADLTSVTRDLRDRYLLEVRHGRQYRVHPIVRETHGARLREDSDAWRSAHRRAGEWFARRIEAARQQSQPSDARLALAASGARAHLVAAEATDVLADALRAAAEYIERHHGWAGRRAATAAERDARISLLEVYVEHAATPGTLYQLAKLLKERGGPNDRERAMPLAERATHGQDFADPWILWMQLVREVEGNVAAIDVGKRAARHVAPGKSLYAVYQLLGSSLNWEGRSLEAVETLRDGAERSVGNARRLIEEALLFSAAEEEGALASWAGWAKWSEFEVEKSLYDVLLREREGRWQAGAETAAAARRSHPNHLLLTLHEAMCWLGAEAPAKARAAVDSFPLRSSKGTSVPWLLSFVALERGDLAESRAFLSTYLGDAVVPATASGVRAKLLSAWDHPAQTMEPHPAVTFPLLPPALSGLGCTVCRPLHGPPVLPTHRAPSGTPAVGHRKRILSIATEWQSAQGGLSTLNRKLCSALAAAGADVSCVVLQASDADLEAAEAHGVRLVTPPPSPGANDLMQLARKPALDEGVVPDVVIGHGRVTGPAAKTLVEDHFPRASRLHVVHMAPDEIEWEKLDRSDDAGTRAEVRTELEVSLGRTSQAVVAVGPRLHARYLTEFAAYDDAPPVLRLDPGFDSPDVPARLPPPGSPWRVLVVGRTEDARLKGLDLAAGAVGRAERARGESLTEIELLVRGTPPDSAEELRRGLTEWAAAPSLRIVVRPYAAGAERIEADLRRASLLLMPSRSEGFGLAGLEAIVAGTPVLVSSSSGLGLLLREALGPDEAIRFAVSVDADDAATIARWSSAIEAVLMDREAAFSRAADLRRRLADAKPWSSAIRELVAALELRPER